MKKNLTELVMILDRSGSMSGLESDTIGGYNSMLKKQMETEGEVLVSTVLFDDRSDVLYDRVPLEKMPQMITTDGLENASHRYSYDRVKEMVERQKAKYGWEFLFLGANIDAIEVAGRFGIGADRAANYNSDHEGTVLNYKVLAETVCEMRACSEPIGAEWKERIDEDYRKRGRKQGNKQGRKQGGKDRRAI